ncbi:unnamed protein product, partial [Allacma fusca]
RSYTKRSPLLSVAPELGNRTASGNKANLHEK